MNFTAGYKKTKATKEVFIALILIAGFHQTSLRDGQSCYLGFNCSDTYLPATKLDRSCLYRALPLVGR